MYTEHKSHCCARCHLAGDASQVKFHSRRFIFATALQLPTVCYLDGGQLGAGQTLSDFVAPTVSAWDSLFVFETTYLLTLTQSALNQTWSVEPRPANPASMLMLIPG